jgi:hypothetical protein
MNQSKNLILLQARNITATSKNIFKIKKVFKIVIHLVLALMIVAIILGILLPQALVWLNSEIFILLTDRRHPNP